MINQQIDPNFEIYTVVSFIPVELKEYKPGLLPSHYNIQESDGITPSVLHVGNAIHYVYLDETRGNLPVRDHAKEVANSIVDDYVNAQLGVDETAKPALFVIAGKLTPQEILDKYKPIVVEYLSYQMKWFENICRIADDDWTRYKKHTVISDFQRLAARLLNLSEVSHEWMASAITDNQLTSKPCISCNAIVSSNAVVCHNCKCVLDPEKYKSLQFA